MATITARPSRDARVTAYLPADVAEALSARAAAEERSVSSLVALILRDTLTTSEAAGQGRLREARRTVRDHVAA